ncbi:MAG: hypothetical protein U0231_16290 [Nitrospiraceae bacterium]
MEARRLVGAVLAELTKSGTVTRDQMVLVSKIGYVRGQNLVQAKAREKAGKPCKTW